MCNSGRISREYLRAIDWWLDVSRRISDTGTNYRPDFMYSDYLIHTIAIVHGSFANLIDSVRSKRMLVRSVDDLMRVRHTDRSRY